MGTSTDELQGASTTKIANGSETMCMDLSTINGKNRAHTEAVDIITGLICGVITVGATAVEARIGGSRYANRRIVHVYNASNNTIYYGCSAVTTTTGIPLLKGQIMTISIGDAGLYLIAASAGNSVRLIEGA